MQTLSDIYSLQVMTNMNVQTLASLNPTRLHLFPASKSEKVRPAAPNEPEYPRYYQNIEYDGTKLILQSPLVEMSTLDVRPNMIGNAALIPVTGWLRQQLTLIEQFVHQHVQIPKDLLQAWPHKRLDYYTSLFEGTSMFITLSKFCQFTRGISPDNCQVVDSIYSFGKGMYSFRIEIPNVYIGPHKGGELFALNLRVIGIYCQVETDSVGIHV